MKSNKFGLTALLAVTGLLAFGPLAQAQEKKPDSPPAQERGARGNRQGQGQRQDQLKRMTDELKLTAEQQEKVKAALKEQTDKMAALRQDTALSREDRQKKTQELRTALTAKLKTILTTEQFDKWEKLRPQQGQRRGQGQGQGQGGQGQRRRNNNN